MTGGTQAEQAAREAHDSPWLQLLARVGIAARGLVWLVIGLLALSVLLRGGDQQTDQQGALRAIADRPLGTALLVVLLLGFVAYAVWLVLSAAVGHREQQGRSRLLARGESAVKAVVYAALAVTVLRFLTSGGGADRTASTTAELMGRSGGRWLVGLAGAVVVAVGIGMVVRALRGDHMDKLDPARLPAGRRRLVDRLGTVGQAGRGVVVALLGGYLVDAAVRFDAGRAKGLDAGLQSLAGQPYGTVLLALVVVGVLAFAAWSFVEAACRRF